jgi:DNA-binding response OmpR family regulator
MLMVMTKQVCKKILLLEDNQLLAKSIQYSLQKKLQLKVDWTNNVIRAIELCDHQIYDLVIADWLLEHSSGLDLVTYVNQFCFQTKILMLSQQSLIAQRLKAYRCGVDDYLTKPFDLDELIIKTKKLLNTYKLNDSGMIKVKNVTLFPAIGKLLIGDLMFKLRPKESELIKILIVNSPRVFSKQKLLAMGWPNIEHRPSINTIEVYIRRIRQKLGKCGKTIKNKRGFGYYFESGKEQ